MDFKPRLVGVPLVPWEPFLAVVENGEETWIGVGPDDHRKIADYGTWKAISSKSTLEVYTAPAAMAARGSGGRWWKIRPGTDLGKLLVKMSRITGDRVFLHLRDGNPVVGVLPEGRNPQKMNAFEGYGGRVFLLTYPLDCAGSADLLRLMEKSWLGTFSQVGNLLVVCFKTEDDQVKIIHSLPTEMMPDECRSLPTIRHAHVTGEKWLVRLRLPIFDGIGLTALNSTKPPAAIRFGENTGDTAQAVFPAHEWPRWAAWLYELGITWTADDGFDPELPGRREIDERRLESLPGWTAATSTGRTLRGFQREGVRFLVSHAGRALLADDMGLGKTAQAIAAAIYQGGSRNLVVCPTGIRSVWREELLAWGAALDQDIHVLDGTHDRPTLGDRWIIASYDQISVRTELWRCSSEEGAEIAKIMKRMTGKNDTTAKRKGRCAFDFGDPFPGAAVTDSIAAIFDEKRLQQWQKFCARRRGGLLEALAGWSPDTLIFDEAHRVKNSDAKRTAAAITLSGVAESCMLLSGTPIQNRASEPAVLLHVMDPGAFQKVKVFERFTIERIKGLLQPSMLRRLKSAVLTELPAVTEQIIRVSGFADVDVLVPGRDGGMMSGLAALTEAGHARLDKDRSSPTRDQRADTAVMRAAWSLGTDPNQLCPASIPALGIFEKLRSALGAAKAKVASDFLEEILENRGRAVVFTAHHAASDQIRDLVPTRYKTSIIDGRANPDSRQVIVEQFQGGKVDCLIAGMDAAGEGITLHRADTALFIELAVKASTLRQARDRLHRIGQANPVHAIYLIADHPVDEFFEALCLAKADLTGKVLGEQVHILADVRGESAGTPDGALLNHNTPLPATALLRTREKHPVRAAQSAALLNTEAKAAGDALLKNRKKRAKRKSAESGSVPTRSAAHKAEECAERIRAQTRERVARHRAKNPERYRAYMRELMRRKASQKKQVVEAGTPPG